MGLSVHTSLLIYIGFMGFRGKVLRLLKDGWAEKDRRFYKVQSGFLLWHGWTDLYTQHVHRHWLFLRRLGIGFEI
jgi:hypothetical protein